MITIGAELEQSVAAISCCCGLTIDWSVVDQIELDSREDQVAARQYVLHDSKRFLFRANVEDYERDSVTLHLDRGRCKYFDRILSATMSPGFGVHAYFLERHQKTPRLLRDAISSAHPAIDSKHRLLRISLLAVRHLDAITRCFLNDTGVRPTPYLVYATNVRTMRTRQLKGDDASPYMIKGYR